MSLDKSSLAEFVVLLFFALSSDKFITTCDKTENVWKTAGRLTGLLLHNCMQLGSDGPQEQFLLILQGCLRRGSLVVLDRTLNGDVIKLANGIELVRYRKENDTDPKRDLAVFNTAHKSDNEMEVEWKNEILRRIAHLLQTHVLKIRLNNHEELKTVNSEARGRKRRQNMMMSLMMFGIAAVALIMVPMGFQFLAVLGGKALLLAKMALILTAIQGLKKIATSNVNYGLYSTPDHHHHGHCKDELCSFGYNPLEGQHYPYFRGHYDRQWPHDVESHDVGAYRNNYHYQDPDQQADLLHPLHPRVDSYKELF